MKRILKGVGCTFIAVALLSMISGAVFAKTLTVGVSWSNFQEERWKTDEAAMKAQLKKLGAKYISADAQADSSKQISDVENLIARGCDALIILAYDADAISPAISKARAEGIPVVGYDRLIEDRYAFYLTFDNKEVGRLQAREVFRVRPAGNYVFIKGSPTDPNADFLHAGQLEVLKQAMLAGKIKNVGEQYTEGWKPEIAQKNMEQILTATNNKVDAVVASNDGTAGGVVAALTAQGMEGLTPVSGQDGDHAALNRVARGIQTVSVWKDARELGKAAANIAVALAGGKKIEKAIKWAGGPKAVMMNAILLKPVPITRENLNVVIDAGWVKKEVVCQGVNRAKAPDACK
jgi:D-xylose transport system substrate-binding protein